MLNTNSTDWCWNFFISISICPKPLFLSPVQPPISDPLSGPVPPPFWSTYDALVFAIVAFGISRKCSSSCAIVLCLLREPGPALSIHPHTPPYHPPKTEAFLNCSFFLPYNFCCSVSWKQWWATKGNSKVGKSNWKRLKEQIDWFHVDYLDLLPALFCYYFCKRLTEYLSIYWLQSVVYPSPDVIRIRVPISSINAARFTAQQLFAIRICRWLSNHRFGWVTCCQSGCQMCRLIPTLLFLAKKRTKMSVTLQKLNVTVFFFIPNTSI